MSWDTVIAIAIIVTLILSILAKFTNQTIKELLIDIKEILQDRGEEQAESVTEVWA